MINKPKYKIARRLGPGMFDKTQTQKFALREGRRVVSRERSRPKSRYGLQLLEKQKARVSYGINDRQFSKYVRDALADSYGNPGDALFERLETRLDNVVYRLHLAPSRQASRQIVSHGHITVNGIRITIPSYNVKKGDELKIREASAKSPLFQNIEEQMKNSVPPAWLSFDLEKRTGLVQGRPKLMPLELIFEMSAILEFYRAR